MIEFSQAEGGLWRQGFAGDTLNTAWYARACLPADASVAYFSATGRDALSDAMIAFMDDAGINTSFIIRHPTRTPGLYIIKLTDGERSFIYWRENAAARVLADDREPLALACGQADWLYVTGITLAILTPDGREALLSILADSGRRVVFDPNLRPRLWENAKDMRDWVMRAAAQADVVLPSFDDEAVAFGDADPAATAARYAAAGAGEVVVKNAGGPMVAIAGGEILALSHSKRRQPVDSTGAGDSFNGAYIAARMQDLDIVRSTTCGQNLARRVIGHRGALMPMNEIRSAHEL